MNNINLKIKGRDLCKAGFIVGFGVAIGKFVGEVVTVIISKTTLYLIDDRNKNKKKDCARS